MMERTKPRTGIAEFSIDGEETKTNCRLDLDRFVLKVYEQGDEGKLLVCLNFDMYKYNYRFNGYQIVLKSTSSDPSLFMFDI